MCMEIYGLVCAIDLKTPNYTVRVFKRTCNQLYMCVGVC